MNRKISGNSDGTEAVAALRRASRIAEEYGIADMSLDEINDEIAAARGQELSI